MERWRRCEIIPGLVLDEITSEGQIRFHALRPSSLSQANECLRVASAEQARRAAAAGPDGGSPARPAAAPSAAPSAATIAFTYQVADDGSGRSAGSGDGRVHRQETVDLVIQLKNVGRSALPAVSVEVQAPALTGLALREPRAAVGALRPDEVRAARVTLSVGRELAGDHLPLRLLVRGAADALLLDEELRLPVQRGAPPRVIAVSKLARVRGASVRVHSGAGPETSVLAAAAREQVLEVTGELAEWYRVKLGEREAGWVVRAEVADVPAAPAAAAPPAAAPSGAGVASRPVTPTPPAPPAAPRPAATPPTGGVVRLFQGAPPKVELDEPAEGAQVASERIQLRGAAATDRGVDHLEIRVNGQPVVRKAGPADLGSGGERRTLVTFSERVALREGANEIAVVVGDADNLVTTKTLRVTRVVEKGTIWAVVIGISRYKKVRSLRFADRDATQFADYLTGQLGVPRDQVTRITNEEATNERIKRTLGTELRRRAGEKDTVIIYFAGHGAPDTDATSRDGDGLEKYLVPHDADPDDLYTTALPMREMETILDRLSSDRVIVITDACFSGAVGGGRTFSTGLQRAIVSDNFMSRVAKGKGRVIITASRAGELSHEREDLRAGVFTYYLLEGLRGAAADKEGIVTVDAAYDYVARKVPAATGQNQHPIKRGEVEGQLILGRTPPAARPK